MVIDNILKKDFSIKKKGGRNMKEYIKLGFGFFIGYEVAKTLNEAAGEVYTIIKNRIKNGY